MKVLNVKYNTDCVIKIRCRKTISAEAKQVVPELVRCATIFYSISLIKEPKRVIEEVCKIKKDKIEIRGKLLAFSFHLEELHKPLQCKISIHKIVLSSGLDQNLRISVEQSFLFSEIYTTKALLPQTISENKSSQSS